MKEKLFHNIGKIIESRGHIAQQALEQYEPLVNNIMNSKNKDVNYISHTLDYMLDFCFDEQMLLLYRRLCRYLFDIDPQAAADFVQAYREIWDEKGENFGNKN